MISYLKDTFTGFFVICVAFSYSIFMILQTAFGFYQEGSKLFQVYSGALCIFVLLCFLKNISIIPKQITFKVCLLATSIIILYFITGCIYLGKNVTYNSMFLSMGVRFLPAVLLGAVIVFKERILIQIEKGLLPFVILYTVTLANHIFNSSLGGNMGLSYNFEGLNYQTISYYSIFAFGFTMYLLTKATEKYKRYGLIALALLQLYVTISAGGRGAFALGIVFFVYFSRYIFPLRKLIVFAPIIIIGLHLAGIMMESSEKLSMGFTRIWDFWSSSDSIENDGRWVRYNLALNAFLESPFWGNGIGSVFYKVGFYSHNIFTDLLCEGGFLLTTCFLFFVARFYFRAKLLILFDYRFTIFVIIFLCSFVNLLFSGYYLSDSGIWVALSYILCFPFNQLNYSQQQ